MNIIKKVKRQHYIFVMGLIYNRKNPIGKNDKGIE